MVPSRRLLERRLSERRLLDCGLLQRCLSERRLLDCGLLQRCLPERCLPESRLLVRRLPAGRLRVHRLRFKLCQLCRWLALQWASQCLATCTPSIALAICSCSTARGLTPKRSSEWQRLQELRGCSKRTRNCGSQLLGRTELKNSLTCFSISALSKRHIVSQASPWPRAFHSSLSL